MAKPNGGSSVICIASHDAGGAEILASYVAQSGTTCRLVLEGPAIGVFKRIIGPIEPIPLAEAINSSDWCLFGTSWQSDLEWRAIEEARRAGKHVVTFLDHWVNYAERFVRNGVQHLPDEIWVGDEEAHALARQHFPQTSVTLVPNPYFARVTQEIARHETQKPRRIGPGMHVLFVCENISEHARLRYGDARHWGYTEFDAIKYFFSRIEDIGVPIERIILRPHPSDPPGKYSSLISEHAPLAEQSSGRPLFEEIAECDIVAGCESMAQVVALLANRRVLCAVPPGQRVSFMDRRPGVEMLRDLPTTKQRTYVP
jgi:hypothetical protein